MRFKESQKVRVRNDIPSGDTHDGIRFIVGMRSMCDKVVTIRNIERNRCYHIMEMGCAWVDEWLLPVGTSDEEFE